MSEDNSFHSVRPIGGSLVIKIIAKCPHNCQLVLPEAALRNRNVVEHNVLLRNCHGAADRVTHLQLRKDAFHCCHSYVYKLRAHTSLAGILQHLPLETIRITRKDKNSESF